MSYKYVTEVHRRVYEDTEGEYVEVAPSPDFPGNVIIRVPKDSIKYFGNVSLDMPAEFMKQLGEALIAASAEAAAKI